MRSRTLTLVAALALTAASGDAQVATFSAIDDAEAGVCYDAATSVPDPAAPNTLVIGVNAGTSPTLWTNNACIASTSAFHARTRSDTIAVHVDAPPGFYVSRVTFTQAGSATASRVAQVFAGAQWTVAGDARAASLTGATVDLSGDYLSSLPVSFSIFLGAKINGTSGAAAASVSSPRLTVELTPLPAAAAACGNGIDDDGDGFADFGSDPGCASLASTLENPQCDDQLDNDGDALIDTLDGDCAAASDVSESASVASGSCGIGPELALAMPGLALLRRWRLG